MLEALNKSLRIHNPAALAMTISGRTAAIMILQRVEPNRDALFDIDRSAPRQILGSSTETSH